MITDDPDLPLLWRKYIPFFLILLILITPIPFGSVHPFPKLLIYFSAILALTWCTLSKRCYQRLLSKPDHRLGSRILFLLLLFSLYVFCHTLMIQSISSGSPLKLIPSLTDRVIVAAVYTLPFTCFLSLFAATLSLCRSHEETPFLFTRFILISGLVVALIALSHWFADNGRLFWTFSPDSVFRSHRARWPFVNANHLAHFLLIPLFLSAGFLLRLNEDLIQSLERRSKHSGFSLPSFFSRSRTQRRIFYIGIAACWMAVLFIAILASLSRSAWISLVVGALLMLTLQKFFLPSISNESQTGTAPKPQSNSKSKRRRKSRSKERDREKNSLLFFAERLLSPKGIIQAVSISLLFIATISLLNSRGIELVESRVEQGLSSSKNDLRFMLYQDSAPLLLENPIFGVGLDRWNVLSRSLLRESLANINPVFLHSDPYQLLIELGAFGALFWLLIALLVLQSFWKILRNVSSLSSKSHRSLWNALMLLVGLTSLFTASLFDFPFRIPAICVLAAISLGILCSLLEKLLESTSQTT